MSFEDADIVEALQALESEIPDGYFEEFSRKVAARLEVDGMQQSDLNAGGPASGLDDAWVPTAAAETPERDENSGLHEIQQLASTAKRRISSRMSSQSDAEEALLASSSSGLHAIVLPKPGKEARGEVVSLATASQREAAVSTATAGPEPSTGIPTAVWAAVGTLAIAAAVVFFVVRSGGSSDGDSTVAANAESSSGAGATAVAEGAAAPADSKPSAAPLSEEDRGSSPPPADTDRVGDGADAPAIADNSETDEPQEASDDESTPRGAAVAVAKDRSKSEDADKDKSAKRSARDEKVKEKESKKDSKKGAGAASDDGPDKKSDSAKPAKGDMNDLLDSVTGGVEEGPAETEKKVLSKKSLDRGDVATAMGAVRSRAGACHDKEGATGQVKIRFTVAPSGKVSSAKATGKFAGTPTGSCVAAAVKGATFPAFDGRPMAFTFPFLLSQ